MFHVSCICHSWKWFFFHRTLFSFSLFASSWHFGSTNISFICLSRSLTLIIIEIIQPLIHLSPCSYYMWKIPKKKLLTLNMGQPNHNIQWSKTKWPIVGSLLDRNFFSGRSVDCSMFVVCLFVSFVRSFVPAAAATTTKSNRQKNGQTTTTTTPILITRFENDQSLQWREKKNFWFQFWPKIFFLFFAELILTTDDGCGVGGDGSCCCC